MRFTSLIVELIRARPRLVVWVVLLVQGLLWLLLPLVFYGSPPGDVATVLAIGREYQVGSDFGPPLAFWLADIAYRAAGNHIFGVYLLGQLCFIATFWALFQLGRAIVGGPHAALAVLLTMTAFAFGLPGTEFGPAVLARPLWALLLLHTWRIIGEGRRNAWFALSIEAGLLLLTTSAAVWLLALVAAFFVATPRGRIRLTTFDPLYAIVVVAVLTLPWMVWLARSGALAMAWPPSAPGDVLDLIQTSAMQTARLVGWLLLSIAAIIVLTVLNSRRATRRAEDAPVIYRKALDPLARPFVYFFALAPALAGCVIGGVDGRDGVAGGDGVALLATGLAVVVASGDLIALRRQRLLRKVWAAAIGLPALAAVIMVFIVPWIGGPGERTSLPAPAMARFFGESFERRTGRPLPSVAGDPELAALIAMGASRPHLFMDASPQKTPWLTPARFAETGGVVVWRALDTIGAPPADLARRFPGLVAEIPRAFNRLIEGRQPSPRIGWAIVRPKTP